MSINRRYFVIKSALAAASLISLKNYAKIENIVESGLAEIFNDDFLIGTAISNKTLVENDTAMLSLISKEFNAVTTENALKWINNALDKKEVVMGFGHRVYKSGDSRVPTMREYFKKVAKIKKYKKFNKIYDIV